MAVRGAAAFVVAVLHLCALLNASDGHAQIPNDGDNNVNVGGVRRDDLVSDAVGTDGSAANSHSEGALLEVQGVGSYSILSLAVSVILLTSMMDMIQYSTTAMMLSSEACEEMIRYPVLQALTPVLPGHVQKLSVTILAGPFCIW